MKILITGASGMLGGDFTVAARELGHEVIALSRSDLDLTDQSAVETLVREHAPATVVNCAAWTDVEGAETHEEEATEVNASGAGYLGAAAAAIGASICQISTDYVFDGTKGTPYVESDPTSPIQAYGRSKLAGEEAVRSANPDHFIVRTSWLFGIANESPNFVETMLELGSTGEPVKVVHDQIGSPSYTGHLAGGLARLIETDSYGIHHISGSGQCSWYGFAEEIFRQAQMEVDLIPIDSAEFPRPAIRPGNSVLVSEWDTPIMLPKWQTGLTEYLQRRGASDAGEVTA
ncbi:MAG: dTDP-4-dehydrorhamnose reductase [bacterium]